MSVRASVATLCATLALKLIVDGAVGVVDVDVVPLLHLRCCVNVLSELLTERERSCGPSSATSRCFVTCHRFSARYKR